MGNACDFLPLADFPFEQLLALLYHNEQARAGFTCAERWLSTMTLVMVDSHLSAQVKNMPFRTPAGTIFSGILITYKYNNISAAHTQ
jgi:hypothetical protein